MTKKIEEPEAMFFRFGRRRHVAFAFFVAGFVDRDGGGWSIFWSGGMFCAVRGLVMSVSVLFLLVDIFVISCALFFGSGRFVWS